MLALGVLVLGSMLVAGGENLLQGAGCTGGTCLVPAGRPALAAAIALAGWGVLWRALVAVGPVAATRAEASWVLSTPADRLRLLLPALGKAVAASLLAGAVLGCVAVTAVSATRPGPVEILLATGGGALLGTTTAAMASLVQGSGWRRGRVALPWQLAMGLAAGSVVLSLTGQAPPSGLAAPSLAGTPAALALLAAAGTTVIGLASAVRGLPRLRLVELSAAGDVQAAVQGALILLDAGRAASMSTASGSRAGVVRSRAGQGAGAWAFVQRQVVSMTRQGPSLLAAAGLLLVPALMQLLAGTVLALLVAVFVGIRVARSAAGPLLAVVGSSGLARALPFAGVRLTVLLLVVPGVITLTWAGALVALLGMSPWAVVPLAVSALAALVRSARPADLSTTGALVMTEAGPVPVGIVARLVRGPDVALIAIAPLLLQLAPAVTTAVPLLLLALVLRHEAKQE